MTSQPHIVALVVAAGSGVRVGGALPKQYQLIGGKALLRYSVEALLAHPAIAAVQVIIHPGHAELYAQALGLGAPLPAGEATRLAPLLSSPLSGEVGGGLSRSGEGGYPLGSLRPHPEFSQEKIQTSPKGEVTPAASLLQKLLPPIPGGAERADSVKNGLAGLAPRNPEYVLIHDAARPFLSSAMIDALMAKLAPGRAVLPAMAVADTVRRRTESGWEEVSRTGLMRVQTPQGFDYAALVSLCGNGIRDSGLGIGKEHTPQSPTDEAALWLAAGLPLDYVEGEEELRKVTTPADVAWAEKQAGARRVAVGSGYDVHALMPAGEAGVMRLGGIDIPSAHKLHGHSDADVVLHAIVDALLGALAEGDIGSHFPPSDERWRGADSSLFVAEALRLVRARGGEIQHLDVTIIAERPKISPHRDAMRAAIATMLALPLSHVSVKATTTEKLGFTGREEGIAAHATATLLLPHA